MDFDQKYLKSLLSYDRETGVFIWLKNAPQKWMLQGQPAGYISEGYVLIKIGRRKYRAHRLAWLYEYGCWPSTNIDHRDGNPANNAIGNLREATQRLNLANRARNRGKALPKGVRLDHGKYTARIGFLGRSITIGTYKTIDAAADAYAAEARRLYGEYARPC